MTENEIIENDDVLYHYTTQEGLIGILESNCLWATHYKFLNDYSELMKSKEKLIQFLIPIVFDFKIKNYFRFINSESKNFKIGFNSMFEKMDIDSQLFYQTNINKVIEFVSEYYSETSSARKFIEHFYKNFINEVYICSFCDGNYQDKYINENGLLSQWRGYGGDGGFAIIFAKSDIKKLLDSEDNNLDFIFMDNVIYSDDDYEFIFNNYLNDIIEFVISYLKEEELDNPRNAILSMLHCFTRYKDYGFKEEQETRVIATILSNNKKRYFRDKENGEQIPYIKLFDFNEPLPIKKIIVGPHKDKEARATWLKVKLASMGKDDIEVTVSKIPFVER